MKVCEIGSKRRASLKVGIFTPKKKITKVLLINIVDYKQNTHGL